MICPRCSVGEISEATQECLVCGFSRTGGVLVETSSEWNRVEDPLLPALERQFAVEGVLRRGSTSRIYLARDQVTGRLCSLKVLPLGEDVPEGLIERFRKDAQRAATLDHPHLVSLLSYGATDEAIWYAMEYVQGRSLGDLLRTGDRMDLKTCLRLVEQIASALEYGHRRGITHGNLKPANVLVDPEGWARVADLGVSAAFGALPRRAPEQSIEDNYGHTAPEQFGPEGQLSPAADQYALSVVAFYCLARRPPIVGDTLEEITRHHREGPVPLIAESRPDLPAYVSSALARAMSRAPADRFPGVLDFVTAMSGVEVVQATEEKATAVAATVDTAAEPQPSLPEPEPAPAATAESTAVPATTAESKAAAESPAVESAAAEPASTSEPESERKPEPELVVAMSEAVGATSAASPEPAVAETSAPSAAEAAAEPPGPPLLLVERPHFHHDDDDEEEDAQPKDKEPVLLWADHGHEAAVAAAAVAAAATAENAPADESTHPLQKVWSQLRSQLRPRLRQLVTQSRQLAARWWTLPRNIRYGSSAGVAVLLLGLAMWRVAQGGRDEKRPPVPINEPRPTGVVPPSQTANPSGSVQPRPTPPRSSANTPRGSTSSGTATRPDSGTRRPSRTVEPAHLFINSTPWGVLFIDGRQLGNLPQAGVVDVPPGTHTIRIIRDGYLPYESVIAIEAGEALRLTDIVLQERPQ
ncbi:MAG TPA: protein kinase [Gemmatimonadales bacterium]|nr:protein kinase [Gemmatimonadales bacterium]